jgi:hypothetical protein
MMPPRNAARSKQSAAIELTLSQNNSAPAAGDIGMSRQDIHAARITRDAEVADPDIVRTEPSMQRLLLARSPAKRRLTFSDNSRSLIA